MTTKALLTTHQLHEETSKQLHQVLEKKNQFENKGMPEWFSPPLFPPPWGKLGVEWGSFQMLPPELSSPGTR